MSGSGAGKPGEDMYGWDNGSYGLMPKARTEMFHHHTYDLIKKLQEEVKEANASMERWFGKFIETEKKLNKLQEFVNKTTRQQPFYKGNGNHSIGELEKLCVEFVEYCYQKQLKIQELSYDLRIGKVHKREELIRVIDNKPYILDKDKKGIVWCETIIPPDRLKRFRSVTIEDALTRGFHVI